MGAAASVETAFVETNRDLVWPLDVIEGDVKLTRLKLETRCEHSYSSVFN
jgi:hypothetical protein